ncbi:2-keto-3-deoxygluconate permease [Breoghania sp.]|uniref:2-keto-3-deoxygluconate permease n=1 Tax=Breoghania sp. TaxID=2065378 RepID=UPI002631505E|nr:2-keto-3-deoxygluconate permease [Breoghania sp.]MDJ0929827.1 2-keto-3-deoxygluconate permease [Breoghania sp.]
MQILKSMQKVPAGILNVPMVVTAVVHTFWPSALNIGGATTALFYTGTMTVIGMMLFVTGAQFKISDVAPTVKRGFVLLLTKLIIGVVVALVAIGLFKPDGIWGIPSIALISAIATTNADIYLALVTRYGDNIDRSAFGALNLVSVPAVPLLLVGLAEGQGFDYMVVIATLAPFLIGMLLGNLDADLRKFLAPGSVVVLPFLGFYFGAVIDLRAVVSAGFSELLLTAIVIIINVPILLGVDRGLLRRPGYAACGVVPTAGAAVAVPMLYAANHPAHQTYVTTATAQIAMSVVISVIIMPFLANKLAAKKDAPESAPEPKVDAAPTSA